MQLLIKSEPAAVILFCYITLIELIAYNSIVYPATKMEGIPVQFKNKYFSQSKDGGETLYEASNSRKDILSFCRLNLAKPPFPMSGPFDFVFIRNVMIYFDRPTQEKLVNRYHEVLAPGGLLFIGHSESLNPLSHHFHSAGTTIYKK